MRVCLSVCCLSVQSVVYLSVCLSVFVSVYSHNRTKTAEATITKLATVIVHHEYPYSFNIESEGQRSMSHGHKLQKHIEGD